MTHSAPVTHGAAASESTPIVTGAVHHVTLTVTDVARARAFYSDVLGFQVAGMLGPRALLSNGSVVLALTPPPDPDKAPASDRFSEHRVGLDHLSFRVADRPALERAQRFLAEREVPHGAIKDLGPDFGLYVLALRDPDNIQLELTAPYGA